MVLNELDANKKCQVSLAVKNIINVYFIAVPITSLLKVTDEDSLSEIAQYEPRFENFSLLSKDQTLILFAITVIGVVPCGGPKTSPCISSILQIIVYFWSFVIIGNILRILKA